MDIIFSRISKNPLKNNYVLSAPCTPLPPYFGTFRACLKAQKTFESNLQSEFKKLSKRERSNFVQGLKGWKLYRNVDFSSVL